VAYVALFCALGLGTAYAVERNSIGTKEIAKGAIRSSDVRDDDQKNGGLDAGDLQKSAVGTEELSEVPSVRLFSPAGCTTDGTVPPGDDAVIGFTQTDFAEDGVAPEPCGIQGRGAGPVRIEEPGLYMVSANLVWADGGPGGRSLQLWREGEPSPFADVRDDASGISAQSVTDVQRLGAGDAVHVTAAHDANQPFGVAQGAFSVVWLGP
jgi:hypothetical protein